MKKVILILLTLWVLGMAACTNGNLMPKTQPEATAGQIDKAYMVVVKDEQKEIEVTEPVVFDTENNALLSLPTHIGGNIEFVVDGMAYVVCYGHGGELVLEKDGRVYALDGLTNIIETATGLSLDELCTYTVVKNGQASAVEGWSRREIFDMLAVVFDSAPLEASDTTGEYVRFSNKLGADFDLYAEQGIIYSRYLDMYFDATAYQDEISDITFMHQ